MDVLGSIAAAAVGGIAGMPTGIRAPHRTTVSSPKTVVSTLTTKTSGRV